MMPLPNSCISRALNVFLMKHQKATFQFWKLRFVVSATAKDEARGKPLASYLEPYLDKQNGVNYV